MMLFLALSALLGADGGTERVSVQASRLLIRSSPSFDARAVGEVPINATLEVVARRDGWINVRTTEFGEGWVAEEYVRAGPLSLDEAQRQARAATSAKEALVWWQRAAAIAPRDLDVLKSLQAAYEATGEKAAASRLGRLIRFRNTSLFVVARVEAGDAVIELFELGEGERLEPVAPAAWPGLGIFPDEPVWVLPDTGPPVSGTIVGMKTAVWNECGGIAGYEARVRAPLPKGAVALAVARGERPRSWLEHLEPSRPATGQGRPRREGKGRLIEGPAPRGATVAVLEQEGPEVLGLNGPAPSIEHTLSWTGLDLPKTKLVLMGRVLRVAARDLTGDAQLEVVVTTTCETVMFSTTGTSLLRSEQRCCGC